MQLIFKYLITAAIVVFVSEVAKRSGQVGALIASLPIVAFMVLIWLHLDNQPSEKINNYAYYTFWYVVPTLPMFLLFPYLNQQFGFWLALFGSVVLTVGLFGLWALAIRPFGIRLF